MTDTATRRLPLPAAGFFLVVAFFSLLLAGCAPQPPEALPGSGTIPELPPDPGGSGETLTWFFVPEPERERSWRFHTRDPLLAAGEGRTLWKITGTSEQGRESVYGLIRYSGAERGGYGLVLQFAENPSPEFYLVLIDSLGHLFVGRYREGSLAAITPWRGEPGLIAGTGVENRIAVTERGPGAFDLRFNGGEIREIRDPQPGSGTGDGRGWCAVVTPGELLPLRPVDVRYLVFEEE